MPVDKYGQFYATTKEAAEILYLNPDTDLRHILFTDPDDYNQILRDLHLDYEKLISYSVPDIPLAEFHRVRQENFLMPEKYRQLDIAAEVLNLCKTEHELQRVGDELIKFQERGLFDLLRYLKFLVDTMRENNIVWGVGRGSSVSSYVLFLLGVHKIDSIYYDLSIDEFLK
jgi:DNA polymerase III alpha subunit